MDTLNNGNGSGREELSPSWAKDQEVNTSHPWGQGDPNYTCAERLLALKREGYHPIIDAVSLPINPCAGIRLG